MKVRVLATAPFAFPLKGETLYFFSAGESTIMETSDLESRKHLIQMLSPEYADYLYIDKGSLPADLLEEVQQSTVGVPVEQTEVIPNYQAEDKVVLPSPPEAPAQEPASFIELEPVIENPVQPIPVDASSPYAPPIADSIVPGVEAPAPTSEVVETVPEVVVEETLAEAEELPLPELVEGEEVVSYEEESVEALLAKALADRRAELDSLHWTQLREIAEGYSLTYTNKVEVIDAIIKKEFED